MRLIARLLSWIRRPRPTTGRTVIIRRDPFSVRLEDWRANPGLVKLASGFLSNADFNLMLTVLRNEHLLNYVLPIDTPLEQRAILQARAEGYGTCLANLESLSQLTKPHESVEATYEELETEIATNQ